MIDLFFELYNTIPQDLLIIILSCCCMYFILEYQDYKLKKQERVFNGKKTKKTTD